MALNGWQRIGIVASVIAPVGMVAWAFISDAARAQSKYDECVSVLSEHGLPLTCPYDSWFGWRMVVINLVFTSVVTVACWLIVYAIVYTTKWVKRGFKHS